MEPGAAVLAALSPNHLLGVPRPLFRGCWRAGGAMNDGPWVPLSQAGDRFADQGLVAAVEEATARSRAAGGRPFVVGMLSFDGAGGLSPSQRYGVEAYNRKQRARAAVMSDLRRRLIAGELVARGRPGSLAADRRVIPATLWPHLRISNPGRSILTGVDHVRWYDVEVARSVDAATLPGPVRPVTVPKRRKATEREIIDFMVKLQLGGSVKSMEADREAFLEAHPDLTAPVKYFQDIRGPYALKKGRPPKPK